MRAPLRLGPSLLALATLVGCARLQPVDGTVASNTSVGPPKGSVVVVGGGALGPEIYAKFIELAGGPNALIVETRLND